MRILAIDTALDACSATVFDTELDVPLAIESHEIGRGHAEALLPIVERVMNTAAVGFDTIDRIVATVGPGSFTGLRVGLAAARGFALACDRPCVGITTLAAFAAPYITENDAVPVVVAIDAKHGNLYLQMVGAGGRMLVAPRVSNLRDAVRTVALGPVRLVGNAAAMLAAHWPTSLVKPPVLVDPRPAPDVTWVARLGAAADPARAKPRPLYLRQPDARPQAAQLPRR